MQVNGHMMYILLRTPWYLDGLVCVCDEGDEETEHHVNEKRYERIEINSAEQPHHCVLLLKLGERWKHVIPVDQREETFCHTTKAFKLNHNK